MTTPRTLCERIGVLGGTFDPIHIAHLVAGRCAQHALALDRVLFVVAHDPWQKRDRTVSPAATRLELVKAAIDGHAGFEASDVEIRRGGPTYTADTLSALAAPNRELFLILGADAAARLPTWERPEEVAQLATIAVVGRDGADPAVPNAPVPNVAGFRFVPVAMPRLDVSATDIRRRVAAGAPIDYLVPDRVVELIAARGLYRD